MSWLSPEIAMGQPYAAEVDVWSFGCLCYELTTGQPPFMDLVYDARKFLAAIREQENDRIPSHYSDTFNDFVQKCSKKNKEERWTTE